MPPAAKMAKARSKVDNPAPPVIPDLAAHSLIVHDILRYLDNTCLARCLRVNKYFSSLAGPILYRDIDFDTVDTYDGMKQLILFMEGCPRATKRFQIKPNMKWKPLLLTHVKHITLRGAHYDGLHDEPAMILKLPKLETLRIVRDIGIDPKYQALYPCDLLLGLQPKILIFNCSLRTFPEVGLCWHTNNLKKLERLVLVIHYSEWEYGAKIEKILKLLDGKMQLPAKVDIIFLSYGPVGERRKPFWISHPDRPFLTQRLASLPWLNTKTTIRLINTKVIPDEGNPFDLDLDAPGHFGEEVKAAIDAEIPKGKQGKNMHAAVHEAKSRLQLVDMEDYLREVDWKMIVDGNRIKGWLRKLAL